MATIAQIVTQIRTAIFGKDVRENIAQGIEKCYTDVSTGKTLAETAASNANAKATAAQTAASTANTAATNASNAANAANTAAANVETTVNTKINEAIATVSETQEYLELL